MLFGTSAFAQDFRMIQVEGDKYFVIYFSGEEGTPTVTELSNDTTRVVEHSLGSNLFYDEGTTHYFKIDTASIDSTARENKKLYFFSDIISFDSLKSIDPEYPFTGLGFEEVGVGNYERDSVQQFQASVNEYTGRVLLTWNPYYSSNGIPADGYVIFRSAGSDHPIASNRSYDVVPSGNVTSYQDVVSASEGTVYYNIIAYNISEPANRFVTNFSKAEGSVRSISFEAFKNNEEVVSLFWQYDNSILQGLASEAVNEAVLFEGKVVHEDNLFIDEFNIGNSRLQFNTLLLSRPPGQNQEWVKVALPPLANPSFTLEFWYYTGNLQGSTQNLLTSESNSNQIGIHPNGLIFKGLGQERHLDHSFQSYKWVHFAFTKSGNKHDVVINGQLVGSIPAAYPSFPNTMGQVNGAAGYDFPNSARIGLTRSWSVSRSTGQIRQDMFDLYETNDVDNLINQWRYTTSVTNLPGLTGSGTISIENSDAYRLTWDKAYIFDRTDVATIKKYKTTLSQGNYELEIKEVGPGRLVDDPVTAALTNPTLEVSNPLEPVPVVIDNQLKVTYDKRAPNRIELNYLTGSQFPQSYRVTRFTSPTDSIILVDELKPDQVKHAGFYNKDLSIDLTDEVDINSEDQSYSLLVNLDDVPAEDDQVILSLGGNNLRMDKNNRLYLDLENGDPVFIATITSSQWRQLNFNFRSLQVGGTEVSTYYNGINIAKDTISGSPRQLILKGSEAAPYQLGYLAFKNTSIDSAAVIEQFQTVPNIKKGWHLFYHTAGGSITKKYVGSEDFDFGAIESREIPAEGTSLIEDPGYTFFDYGNIHSELTILDEYQDSFQSIRAAENYTYKITPYYPSTYRYSKFLVSGSASTLDLNFNAFWEEDHAMLKWSLDTLVTYGFDSVQINRNGLKINTVYLDSVFRDYTATRGERHEYELVLVKGAKPLLSSSKVVEVPPNGEVGGYLISSKGEFIVPNQSFELNSPGTNTNYTFTSGVNGRFHRDSIYYGKSMSLRHPKNKEIAISLLGSAPRSLENFVPFDQPYSVNKTTNYIREDGFGIEVHGDYNIISLTLKEDAGLEDFYLNVYVNDTLVKILHKQLIFEDTFSTADVVKYGFKLYTFKGENSVTYDFYELEGIQNADYFPVSDFAIRDNEYFVPALTWKYPGSNRISGFHIYRDDFLVGDIAHLQTQDTTSYEFLDERGKPGFSYTYKLVPYLQGSTEITREAVQRIHTYDDTFFNDFDIAILSNEEFAIDHTRLDDLPFDGFIIRSHGKIASTISKTDFFSQDHVRTFYHHEWEPYYLDDYLPELSLFKYVDSLEVYEVGKGVITTGGDAISFSPANEPILSSYAEALGKTQGFAKVKWSKPSRVPQFYRLTNGDGGEVLKDSLPGTITSYAFAVDSPGAQEIDKVSLYAFYNYDGTGHKKRIGQEIAFQFEENRGSDLAPIENFKASTDATGVIALKWDYPDYGLADFEISRDGEVIAILDNYLRSYIDQDEALAEDEYYTYQARAIYKGDTTKYFNAVGRKKSRIVFSGTVVDRLGKPIPRARVRVDNIPLMTDSVGHYEIASGDFNYGEAVEVRVSVNKKGNSLNELTKTVVPSENGRITTDFRFNESFRFFDEQSDIARVSSLGAYYNWFENNVTLRWTVTNPQYSYIEIYRFGDKIGEVRVGEPNWFVDEDAFPGSSYSYALVPVLNDYDDERVEGIFKTTRIDVPALDPIQFLQATTLDTEGRVLLTWAHPWDNADSYVIRRNGMDIAAVDSTSFYDNTGSPGQRYEYSVRPVVSRNGVTVEGAQSPIATVTFPPVASVENFETTVAPGSYQVNLSWDYPSSVDNVIGVEIEREDDLVASLDAPVNTYEDSDGFPNTLTVYKIYSISEDEIRSAPVYDTIWYPAIDPVLKEQFTIDDSKVDTLEIHWSYAGRGIDAFELIYKEDIDNPASTESVVVEIPYVEDQTGYRYLLVNRKPLTQIEFGIRTKKQVADDVYYSEMIYRQATFPGYQLPNNIELNVRDLYFELIWDYPSFNIDQFLMVVDGREFLLNAGARSFIYPIPLSIVRDQASYTPSFSMAVQKTIDGEIDLKTFESDLIQSKEMELTDQTYLAVKVTATDNSSNGVKVSWDLPEPVANVNRWLISRDKVIIHEIDYDGSESSFEHFDYQAQPGLDYLYEVKGIGTDSNDLDSLVAILIPDLGSIEGQASLLAVVTSAQGGSPIPNSPFTLVGRTGEAFVVARGSTQFNGQVEFINLPYADKNNNPIQYRLESLWPRAYFDGQNASDFVFANKTQELILGPFKYNQSNTVEGRVKYAACRDCGIQDVEVVLETYNGFETDPGQLVSVKKTKSDKDGKLAFAVEQGGNYTYQAYINFADDVQKSYYNFVSDTVLFKSEDFNSKGVFPLIFEDDSSRYPLNLRIADACNAPLGEYEFKVRITDANQQYDSILYTDRNGTFSIEVPPYDLTASIIGVKNPDALSTVAVDYFKSRKIELDYGYQFGSFIQESADDEALIGYEEAHALTYAYFIDDQWARFIKTPTISTNDLQPNSCSKHLVLDGNAKQAYTVNFYVRDNGCDLKDGFLSITNPGASKPLELVNVDNSIIDAEGNISFNKEINAFVYEFIADVPNVVDPYTHLLEVRYFDNEANFLASASYEYIVTGSKPIEGNDVFVDPYNDKIDFPLYVLHDPPGDESYSYIEEGSIFSFSIGTTKDFQFEFGPGSKNGFESVVKQEDYSNWLIDYRNNTSTSQTFQVTVTDRISTSKTSRLSSNIGGYLDGADADVIVGMGGAYAYGITDVVYLDNEDGQCNGIKKRQSYDLLLSEINTTWIYTRSMIQQTVDYYKSILSKGEDEIEFNTNDITKRDGERAEEGVESLDIIRGSLYNWEEILDKTKRETTPACKLCDEYNKLPNASIVAENIAKFLASPKGGTDEIRRDLEVYLGKMEDFCSKDLACDLNEDFKTLSPGDYATYNEAYDAYTKFNMIRSYQEQIKTLERYSRVDNDYFDPEQGVSIGNGIVAGLLSRHYVDYGQAYRIQAEYNKGFMDKVKEHPDFKMVVNDEVDRLSEKEYKKLLSEVEDATDEQKRVLQEQAQEIAEKQRNKIIQEKAELALDNSKKYADDVASEMINGAKEAGKKLAKEAADKLKFSKEAAENIAKKAAKKGVGKAGKIAGVLKSIGSLGFEVAISAGHTFVSTVTYDFLRDNFQADLDLMESLDSKPLEELLGYPGAENITFSGGTTIERSINNEIIATSDYYGYLESSMENSMQVGLISDIEGWWGYAAGSEQAVNKSYMNLVVNMNDRLAQHINTGNTNGRSFEVGYVLSDDDDGDHFNTWVTTLFEKYNDGTTISPRFDLVGGRSSDPYEEGTISRDLPNIEFRDQGGVAYPTVQYDLDPTVTHSIPFKINSGNKFQEGREISISVVPNSNSQSAAMFLGNTEVFSGRAAKFFVPEGDSAVYTELLFEPRPGTFDFTDLGLVARPTGVEGDFWSDGADVFDTLEFELHFRKPVSNLFISARNGGTWFINNHENQERYVFYLDGFDVEGRKSNLDHIQMEYRRLGSHDWKPMLGVNGTVGEDTVGIRRLKQFYEDYIRIYNEPTYLYTWDVSKEDDIKDGNYEVRAIAYDDKGLFNFSNIYAGTIDRKSPQVIGIPEPADGLFSRGDKISVEFNEVIDLGKLYEENQAELNVYVRPDSMVTYTLEDNAFDIVFSDARAEITVNNFLLFDHDGKDVTITLKGIQDSFGNLLEGDSITWSFQLDLYKQSPSPIELLGPDNWVMAQDNQQDTLRFRISGYDVYNKNSSLDYIELRVKRVDETTWRTVSSLDRYELLMHYEALESQSENPIDSMAWPISNELVQEFDGDYEIQAVVFSGEGQANHSNIVYGKIDRIAPQVFGNPQPSDGVFSLGDEVSLSFSETLDIYGGNHSVSLLSGEDSLVLGLDYSVAWSPNAMQVQLSDDLIQRQIGAGPLNVSVHGITDLVGNPLGDTISWDFVVAYSPVPVSPVTLTNGNGWVINRFAPAELPIVITDYDLYEAGTRLDSIAVEYRRVNEGTWHNIETLSKDQLIERFEPHKASQQVPSDTLHWYHYLLPGGDYEIRALAFGDGQFRESAYQAGKIDRMSPQILGKPSPPDGILSYVDHAVIHFTEPINYYLESQDVLEDHVTVYTAEDTLRSVEFSAMASSSSLQLTFDIGAVEKYEGDTLFVAIEGVEDLYGNPLYQQIDWSFRLDKGELGASPVTIASPSDFVVNLGNINDPIAFVVKDYDVDRYVYDLDYLALEYKRIHAGANTWVAAGTLTIDELVASHAPGEGLAPMASLDLHVNDPDFSDGEYEVRVVSYGNGDYKYSNTITGIIDRRKPSILTFSPSDQVVSPGDRISATFNEPIDANRATLDFDVLDEDSNAYKGSFDASFTPGEVVLTPTGDLDALDGKELTVELYGVQDRAGNSAMNNLLSWTFQVDYAGQGPSPVSIKEPSGFVVNQSVDTREVGIVLHEFQLNNSHYALDDITLEYKPANQADWQTLHQFSRNELLDQSIQNGRLEASYNWIVGEVVPEGMVEVRAFSRANGQVTYSSSIQGKVDRRSPELVSLTPADKVLRRYDQLHYTFNEELASDRLVDVRLEGEEGNDLSSMFNVVQASSSITLQPIEDLAALDGQNITVTLAGVRDQAGNELGGELVSTIKVGYSGTPVSPLSILNDDLHLSQQSSPVLEVVINDFDVHQVDHQLDSIDLWHQKIGGFGWVKIDSKSIEALVAENVGRTAPSTSFLWDSGNGNITDGDYELRATAYAGDQFQFSNKLTVEVDRTSPGLVSFDPGDGVYSRGEAVSLEFSEAINDFDFDLTGNGPLQVNITDGSGQDVDGFTPIVFDNTIMIEEATDVGAYDGKEIFIAVLGIKDRFGNEGPDVHESYRVNYFESLSSPVSLRSSGFIVNRTSLESVNFEIEGYDVYEHSYHLDSICLEYRMNDHPIWASMATVTRAQLREDHEGLGTPSILPSYTFDIPSSTFPEGVVEVRAVSYGNHSSSYSGTINGLVDRIEPTVLGYPSPSDKILDAGEEISISFSEKLQADVLEVEITHVGTGEEVNASVSVWEDKVIATLSPQQLQHYLGDSLRLSVDRIRDLAENAGQPVVWTFIVNSSEASLSDLSLLDNDGWVVNQSNENELVPFVYTDFDAIRNDLAYLAFEYREGDTGDWTTFETIERDDLIALGEQQSTVFLNPVGLTEGPYEVRGVVHGEEGARRYSNSVTGIIDRTAPRVIAIQPADSAYQFGDDIWIEFDEDLDCFEGFTYEVVIFDGGQISSFEKLNGVCNGRSLVFGPNNQALFDQKGKTVRITVTEAYDQYGNGISDAQVISFVVGDFFLETSPISIISPDQEWLINQPSSDISVVIGGYDFAQTNYALDSIALEYTKTFDGNWHKISSASLEEVRENYLSSGAISYTINWEPMAHGILEGYYTLRATAYGNGGTTRHSDPVYGLVDMVSPTMETLDNQNGQVSMVFDELLSTDIGDTGITITQSLPGVASSTSGRSKSSLRANSVIPGIYYNAGVKDNELLLNMLESMKGEFANETVEIQVKGIKDQNGNPQREPVIYRLEMPGYEGESNMGSLLTGIYNGKGGVDLSWHYPGTIDCKGFVIERWADDKFDSIAYIQEANVGASYVYSDYHNLSETAFYRLRYHLNENGPVYSKIIGVDIEASSFTPAVSIYPNPSGHRHRVQFKLITQNFEDEIKIRVFDAQGLYLAETRITREQVEDTSFSMYFTDALKPGMYLVEISQADHVSIQRAIIK